jgi:hypothetical protein
MYLVSFPMDNNNVVSCKLDRVCNELILPFFSFLLLKFLLLIINEYVITCLELLEWIHWHYDLKYSSII